MTDALWTSAEIVAATGGALAGPAFVATGVSIDSRTANPGDLFVALPGERDGADFIPDAFARGASGALAAKPADGSCVVVDDVLEALRRLAKAARVRARGARRGAVTGSVGKTSVTQAVRGGLALAGRSHGPVQSYNNHIGVPLTLARMPADTERAVFEIGMNHAGEIAPLSRLVRPHAVAITSVGAAHVENFPDGEAGVARAKAEILAGLERGGAAVLDADSRWFDYLQGEARRAGAKPRTFGRAKGADARLIHFKPARAGASVAAHIDGKDVEFAIRHAGAHWGPMSLCALLMMRALDVDLETGLTALSQFAPLEGRGAQRAVRLARGAFTLIDESYNANPISLAAALDTLGARTVRGGRKIVVLTDMLELGEGAPERHAALAEPIEAAGVDLVFCAGPLMETLWRALPATRRGGYAPTAQALKEALEREVAPGDVVMVKGSKGSRAHFLAAALAALDTSIGSGG
jgi:UDP-N-acetylmuramoyl-tripeptide--D-alanyl-D-alanine ligase